jgi:carbon storage regulator CsrA
LKTENRHEKWGEVEISPDRSPSGFHGRIGWFVFIGFGRVSIHEGYDMLALARGEGQSIIIDGNIEVKIVKWSRSSVRLAIQAPREVAVDRDEIWRKMHPGQLTPLERAEKDRRERLGPEGHPTPPPLFKAAMTPNAEAQNPPVAEGSQAPPDAVPPVPGGRESSADKKSGGAA